MKRPTCLPLKLQQRCNIYFSQRMGVSMVVTVRSIQYVYSDKALTAVQIRHWFKEFQNGRETVVDKPRHAKERSGRTEENITKVRTALDEDRRLSLAALSVTCGIPWSTCQKIVKLDLKLTRKAAKFVPHLLQEQQIRERVWISSNMLSKLRSEPHFLKYIVMTDEMWIYCYDLELKTQSSAWLAKGEAKPTKVARPRAVGKLLLISFFDSKGVIHWEYQRGTLNSGQFINILSNLRHAISRKRGNKFLQNFSLHMDNASPHTSQPTRTFLLLFKTKVVEHPAYLPDLAPSVFWFFARLKKPLRGQWFQTLADLQQAVDKEIGEIASFEFEQCILRDWPKRWARCIDKDGLYFEGLQ